MFLFGVTFEIENFEQIKKWEYGIIILYFFITKERNHQSFFDTPLLSGTFKYFKNPLVAVGKKELENWPFVGRFWKQVVLYFLLN